MARFEALQNAAKLIASSKKQQMHALTLHNKVLKLNLTQSNPELI